MPKQRNTKSSGRVKTYTENLSSVTVDGGVARVTGNLLGMNYAGFSVAADGQLARVANAYRTCLTKLSTECGQASQYRILSAELIITPCYGTDSAGSLWVAHRSRNPLFSATAATAQQTIALCRANPVRIQLNIDRTWKSCESSGVVWGTPPRNFAVISSLNESASGFFCVEAGNFNLAGVDNGVVLATVAVKYQAEISDF